MGYITLLGLARLLGVPAQTIEIAHQKGFLAEPPRLEGREAYDLAEVVKIAHYFGLMPKMREVRGTEDSKEGTCY